jgi:hypothetical protein
VVCGVKQNEIGFAARQGVVNVPAVGFERERTFEMSECLVARRGPNGGNVAGHKSSSNG